MLRQVDHSLGLSRTLAGCFHDTRDACFVDHSVPQLLAQRLYGLALCYEDLNDHAFLRLKLLKVAAVVRVSVRPMQVQLSRPWPCGVPTPADPTCRRRGN